MLFGSPSVPLEILQARYGTRIYNSSTLEAEAEGSLEFEASLNYVATM